jgi:hypothetical protein
LILYFSESPDHCDVFLFIPERHEGKDDQDKRKGQTWQVYLLVWSAFEPVGRQRPGRRMLRR